MIPVSSTVIPIKVTTNIDDRIVDQNKACYPRGAVNIIILKAGLFS
jgi:hypothetical protein